MCRQKHNGPPSVSRDAHCLLLANCAGFDTRPEHRFFPCLALKFCSLKLRILPMIFISFISPCFDREYVREKFSEHNLKLTLGIWICFSLHIDLEFDFDDFRKPKDQVSNCRCNVRAGFRFQLCRRFISFIYRLVEHGNHN